MSKENSYTQTGGGELIHKTGEKKVAISNFDGKSKIEIEKFNKHKLNRFYFLHEA